MKRSIWALGMIAAVLGAVGPGIAMAACSENTRDPSYVMLTQAQITTLLVGNTACYPAGGLPAWENQEYLAGGTITDFRRGSNPRNPTATVGNYTITTLAPGVGQVTYNYTSPSSTFKYVVWGPSTLSVPGLYDFCNSATATFLPFQVHVLTGGPQACS
jgi:hypothetical protein